PSRSVLFPCLHDEAYAYVPAIGSLFRQVAGCLYNSAPERDLASHLYGSKPGGVVGMGFDPHPPGYAESLAPYFADAIPYLLYLGRKETGKNAQVVIDWFLDFKNSAPKQPLRLVICGGGSFRDLERPNAIGHPDIVDLTEVTEEEKHRLIRHTLALVQL